VADLKVLPSVSLETPKIANRVVGFPAVNLNECHSVAKPYIMRFGRTQKQWNEDAYTKGRQTTADVSTFESL
jgi:hypothetical protein